MFGALGTAENKAQGCSWGDWLKSAYGVVKTLESAQREWLQLDVYFPKEQQKFLFFLKKPNVSREKTFTC